MLTVVCALLRPWLRLLGWIDTTIDTALAKAEETIEVWGPRQRFKASAPTPRPVPADSPNPPAGTGHPIFGCPLCGQQLLCPTAVQQWMTCDD